MALAGVAICFLAVSFATLSVDASIGDRWGFSMSHIEPARFLPLAPVPLVSMALVVWLWRDLSMKQGAVGTAPDWRPYLLAAGIFASGYVGLGVSLYPFIVPYEISIHEAAARDNALVLMLVGAVIMLPIILAYTAYVYSLFWGKVKPGDGYHAH